MLAADIAGYSRLIGRDDMAAMEMLGLVRQAATTRIGSFNGRLVDSVGDSMLAEFASVTDAVRSAVEIQRAIADLNASHPPERQMWLRIGIHIGDVLVKGHEVFGDGVNIAARLQAIAEPGGICIS